MGLLNKFTHKKSHEQWLAEHPDKQVHHLRPDSTTSYDDATRERIEQEMESQRTQRQ